MKNQKYDSAFRAEAVGLALSSEGSIAQTARELGLKEGTLYNWVSQTKSQAPMINNEQGNPANLVEELNCLRKENVHLKKERA